MSTEQQQSTRRRGMPPRKFRQLDQALRNRNMHGLLAFIAQREADQPRPTMGEIAEELFLIGKVRVSDETVRRWANMAAESESAAAA